MSLFFHQRDSLNFSVLTLLLLRACQQQYLKFTTMVKSPVDSKYEVRIDARDPLTLNPDIKSLDVKIEYL